MRTVFRHTEFCAAPSQNRVSLSFFERVTKPIFAVLRKIILVEEINHVSKGNDLRACGTAYREPRNKLYNTGKSHKYRNKYISWILHDILFSLPEMSFLRNTVQSI